MKRKPSRPKKPIEAPDAGRVSAREVRTGAPWGRAPGVALALACLTAFAWTLAAFWVDVRLRTFPAPEQVDRWVLTSFRIRLENLRRLDSTNGELRVQYASVLRLQGENRRAIEELKIAQRTHNLQDSLYFIGTAQERMGLLDEAAATMEDCALINPFNVKFNDFFLRLLYRRLERIDESQQPEEFGALVEKIAPWTRNWSIRAPFDPNSYLFAAAYYTKPLDALQAYRCHLMALAEGVDWMGAEAQRMFTVDDEMRAIGQIVKGRFAKPYRGLP